MTPANEASRRVLLDAVRAGKLARTVLLSGPAGSGKLSLALECADALLGDPHHRALRREHPDLVVTDFEDAAFKVGDARALRVEAAKSPTEADVRVFVLRHTQNMTAEAQNALLKLLEEPLPAVYFFLLCENESAMLGTVRSRCLKLGTQPPDAETALSSLRTRFPDADEAELSLALEEADGYPGTAAEILSQSASDDGRAAAQFASDVLHCLRARDELGLWRVLLSRDKMSREETAAFLDALERRALRDSSAAPDARLCMLIAEMRELCSANVHSSHIFGLFSQYFVS